MRLARGAWLLRLTGFCCAALGLLACGGEEVQPPVETTIEGGPSRTTSLDTVLLRGQSFVPDGSSCPASSDYIIIGTLGPHQAGYRNEATSIDGPVFDDLWVCNSGDGRSMSWTSNPIGLEPGDNRIVVTFSDAKRTSSAAVVVTRQ